jgi:hypothetical protein
MNIAKTIQKVFVIGTILLCVIFALLFGAIQAGLI